MLKWFLKKKLGIDKRGHLFTEEETEASHVARRMNNLKKRQIKLMEERLEALELKRMEREIRMREAEFEETYGDDDDGDDENQVLGKFMEILGHATNQGNAPQQIPPEQLLSIKERLPKKELDRLRKLDDAALKGVILQYLGNVDETTINNAIMMVKA